MSQLAESTELRRCRMCAQKVEKYHLVDGEMVVCEVCEKRRRSAQAERVAHIVMEGNIGDEYICVELALSSEAKATYEVVLPGTRPMLMLRRKNKQI